jgi:hypothetical protein
MYALYNDQGDVTGVSCIPTDVTIDLALADLISAGSIQPERYSVVAVKQDGVYVKQIVEKKQLRTTKRIKTFNAIRDTAIAQTLIIEWTRLGWKFILDIDQFESAVRIDGQLVFYVTAEDNQEYIIRTIHIDFEQLLNTGTVLVEFTTAREHLPDTVVLMTRMIFESYGLRITHE